MRVSIAKLICLTHFLLVPALLAQAPGAGIAQPPADAAVLPAPPGNPANAAPARLAKGVHLRENGTLVGHVDYVDLSTLELRPVNNAIVTVIQNRVVVAQKRSAPNGRFEIAGLTPSAVYSVFVTHRDWASVTSVVTLPSLNQNDRNAKANTKTPVSLVSTTRARLAALKQPNGDDALNIQLVPREDFVSAVQSGVMGSDVGGGAPGAAGGGAGPGGAGAGGGGAGTGGGGGGGGGGAGGGLGAAAGALGAAGIAAGAAGDSGSGFVPFASPVVP